MHSMAVAPRASPKSSKSNAIAAAAAAAAAASSSTASRPSSGHNSIHNASSVAVKRHADTNSSVKLLSQAGSSPRPSTSSDPDFVSATASSSAHRPQSGDDRQRAKPRRVEGSFDSALVEAEVRRIAGERLRMVNYEPYACKRISQDLAAELMERLKALDYSSYKIVVMVSLGNRSDAPSLQFGSRCLWNAKTDRLVYVKHTSGSVYAVILVYALHFT